MAYDFASLSPADFEDLVRDLVGRELGVRFEAFAAGPDGGMDGRHARSGAAVIMQAKHYVGSTYAALKSRMRHERPSIDRLSPAQYILATSRPLSPQNKQEVAAIIGPWLLSESDIIGPGDLNSLLRKYGEIEKSHIKLWLTGAAVLERVVRSAAHTFNSITRGEIEAKVRVYAPNPSFDRARDILEGHHIAIISGPPGVGKTTLAEMLCYAYIAEDWELIAIRSLEDGLASINDARNQIFLFDDFLGKVALDRHALSHKDSDLARFIKRIRTSPNARFILTTGAYIFEEARRVSEYLADPGLDVAKFVLDVGVYTRRVKARILYNHLLIAGTPQPHIVALVTSGSLPAVVDHKNHNPRIIEWMTDVTHMEGVAPQAYPGAFLDGLAHPGRLWDVAFRTHISKKCQHLLFALFFGSQYGVDIEELRIAYNSVHRDLCAKYGDSHDPKDFEEALRVLEGSFLAISDKIVSFVNPSLRDYLTEYMDDFPLLKDLAAAARQTDWAQAAWQHGKRLISSSEDLRLFALSFSEIGAEFPHLPVSKRVQLRSGYSQRAHGISNTSRMELLFEWWEASRDQRFVEFALKLAREPVSGLDSWRDGSEAIELIGKLRDGACFDGLPLAGELADALEQAAVVMIEGGMPSDDLETISDAVEEWSTLLSDEVISAANTAIMNEIEEIESIVSDMDSESTLKEYIDTIQKLGKRAAISPQRLERAVERIVERIIEVEERTSESDSPSATGSRSDAELFDDIALANLFAPLVAQ